MGKVAHVMSTTTFPQRLQRSLGAALAAAVIVTTSLACSASSNSSKASVTTGASAPTTSTPVPTYFTGTDEAFYNTPDPLPKGKPGALIRVMRFGSTPTTQTLKIMYHSRDAANIDRPVTALVTYPTAKPPANGWPVLATSPGTVGLDPHCGITRGTKVAPEWGLGDSRVVRVLTDYIGLGPSGQPLHPYLSKPSEGHSVLDAIRAVRHLTVVHAGDNFLSIGHSQGGHGALSASQLAATYAPELHLLGTVALAPAAMLDKVYGGIDPIVTSVLTSMVLYGAASEHPQIHVSDYVTPELAKASNVFRTGCLNEITNDLVPLVIGAKMFKVDPRTAPGARSLIAENEVAGHRTDAPLYLAGGTKDDRVVEQRVRDLYASLCKVHQVTQFRIFQGADHGGILTMSAPDVKAFLEARLNGDKPTNSCTSS